MFEFLKRMFRKKEVPQTVVEPVQPITAPETIRTLPVEIAATAKKAKPRKKTVKNNIPVQHNAWPFEETLPTTKKKVAQKKTANKSVAAITAKQSTKKSRKKKDA